jgi:hypothetical protein
LGYCKVFPRIAAAAALLVPAAFSPSEAGASTGQVVAEIGGAAFLEAGTLFLGTEIVRHCSLGGLRSPEIDTTRRVNPGGYVIGLTLIAAYPLATATGAYALGEIIGKPAANKGAAFGITTFAAYGESLALAFAANMIGKAEGVDSSTVLQWAFWIDVSTKPFLTTYVYNKVKNPAAPPPDSRLAVAPYVCAAAASDGGAVPLYGVTVSF